MTCAAPKRKYPKVKRQVELTGDMFAGTENREELDLLDRLRPKTRGDCASARAAVYADLPDDDPVKKTAPCPWLRCKYHLHLDVNHVVVGGVDADEIVYHESAPMEWTCTLDAVEAIQLEGAGTPDAEPDDEEEEDVQPKTKRRGNGETHEGNKTDSAIAKMLGISDEWVRKIWNKAIARMRPRLEAKMADNMYTSRKKHLPVVYDDGED